MGGWYTHGSYEVVMRGDFRYVRFVKDETRHSRTGATTQREHRARKREQAEERNARTPDEWRRRNRTASEPTEYDTTGETDEGFVRRRRKRGTR